MKLLKLIPIAVICGIALAIGTLSMMTGPAAAESVIARLTGCETKPIAGTNALQFVDPQCAMDAGVTSRPGGRIHPSLDPLMVDIPGLPGDDEIKPDEPQDHPAKSG